MLVFQKGPAVLIERDNLVAKAFMNYLKLILGILFATMGSIESRATGDEGARSLMKAQGLRSFAELAKDKSNGIYRMVWLRGEKETFIFECDLLKKSIETRVVAKSGTTKHKRVLTDSDAAVLNFFIGYIDLKSISAEDPYDGGLDGDSVYMEVHFSGIHRNFSRWALFQSYKLPAVAPSESSDPFAPSSKPAPEFQRKSATEDNLTSLAALMIQMGDAGKLLPGNHSLPHDIQRAVKPTN
jgi:hypothetical protein